MEGRAERDANCRKQKLPSQQCQAQLKKRIVNPPFFKLRIKQAPKKMWELASAMAQLCRPAGLEYSKREGDDKQILFPKNVISK